MDVGKAFRFVFEDRDWIGKVLVGGLVNLIPILNFAVAGYGVRTLRNVARGQDLPLPEWQDFGDYFVKGAAIFVASVIYFVPLIIAAILAGVAGVALGTGSNGGAAAGLGVLGLFAVVYGPLVVLWLPAATAIYAADGDFGAFFRLGEIWAFIAHDVGGYIVALLASLAAAILASIIGGILFGIGTLFTSFIAGLISAHLLGQLLRESRQPVR